MLPILFSFGPVKIYTFGVFLVLAFFWAAFVLWKNIRLSSYKEDDIFDGMFISLIGGLIIGRLAYVMLNFSSFGFDLLKFILINGYPGVSLAGMIVGGFGSFYLFTRSRKIDFKHIIDYAIPPVFLALAIGKVGAFFSGTEIGTQTKFPLSVKYVGFEGFRHLTPFYEGLLFFFGAYLSYRLLFMIRKERYSKGFAFYFFSWYSSMIILLFDSLKAEKILIAGHSFNIYFSAAILLTFSLFFVYYFRSFFFKKIGTLINSAKKNGQKTIQTVHQPAKGETAEGEGKDTQTNRESEKR